MNKDRIIELAREAGAGEPESLYGRTDYVVMTVGDLERFAALIEREVRGDAEPVAYETDQELWAAVGGGSKTSDELCRKCSDGRGRLF